MKLHDEMLFDYCEQLSKADFDYISTYAYTSSESQIIGHSLFNPSSVIRSLDRFENTVTLAVKLKSGQTYYYPASLDSYDYSWKNEEFTLRDILLMNTDYVESNVNLSRFENGKVALPHGLDANFHDTLMRELKALDSDKLMLQFGIGSEEKADPAELMNPWSFPESGEFGNDFQFAVLSDISGNYCRVVAVDENTPESLRMLISYENRKTEKKRGFNETLNALESGSFNIVGGSISSSDDMFQSNFVYFNVDGMNPPALAQQAYVNRETIDTLLNCIEQSRGKTPEPGQPDLPCGVLPVRVLDGRPVPDGHVHAGQDRRYPEAQPAVDHPHHLPRLRRGPCRVHVRGLRQVHPALHRGGRGHRRLQPRADLLPGRPAHDEADLHLRRRSGDHVGLERLPAAVSGAGYQ